VADEVRALAERTTKATKEIVQMIKTIQNETADAVKAMDEGVNEVERGSSDAAKSGTALSEILAQINAISMEIHQICQLDSHKQCRSNLPQHLTVRNWFSRCEVIITERYKVPVKRLSG
jgi:hypothetical protein